MERPRPNFTDSTRWVSIPRVVVFDEHEDKDKDGKVVASYGRRDLERIVTNQRARDKAGALCPLTIGHTSPERPENEQPPIVGYARGWDCAWDDELQKWVIVTNYYIRKEWEQAAREYPRTSIELWRRREQIDPIALLKRTPDRDLPQWTYARAESGDEIIRYSLGDPKMKPLGHPDHDEREDEEEDREEYESDDDEDDDDDDEEEDRDIYSRLKPHIEKYMAECYPSMKKMHAAYISHMNGSQPPAPPAKGRSKASETEKPIQHARLDELARRNEQLEQHVARLIGENALALGENCVIGLESEGYRFKNREREVKRFALLDEEGRQERRDEIREHHKREAPGDPARFSSSVGFLPTSGGRGNKELTEADLDEILAFSRDRGVSYDEAEQNYRKEGGR